MARTIAGTLKDPNGTALASTDIIFTPSSFFDAESALILPQPETVTTNGSGAYTVNLATGITYKCQIKNFVFNFDLEAGASTSLDALL